MDIELNHRQQATVASAIALLSAVFIAAVVFGAIFAVSCFLNAFSNVFLPLAFAAILALIVKPYYEWLEAGTHSKWLALAAVFASLVAPLAGFLWFFGSLVLGQLSELVNKFPQWVDAVGNYFRVQMPSIVQFWNAHELGPRLSQTFQARSTEILNGLSTLGGQALAVGAGVFRFVAGCFGWVVFPIYFGFFLTSKPLRVHEIEKQLPFLKPETRRDAIYLATEFVNIIVSFFRGQVIIAFCQGLLFSVGFAIAGVEYGLVIGLMMGCLNLIPYLGTALGLSIALPLAFFQPQGGWATVASVVAAFLAVQGVEAYVLTPRIMGKRTGLHPVMIMVAIFFWGTALGGVTGIIFAIPLTAFLVVFWRLLKENYIKAVV